MKTYGIALAVSATLFLSGCQRNPPIRIGAKPFTEQEILAEMAAQLLRAKGERVRAVVECEDTYECQDLLRKGYLDLMVEYTGTGLLYLGDPVDDPKGGISRAKKLYQPLGLVWFDSLGFDNRYELLMPSNQASVLGIKSIADLQKLGKNIRVACPPAYVRRPRDGLTALFERYGLTLPSDPMLTDDVFKRIQALRNGQVDVIVAFATDPALADMDLVTLEDPQHFFPAYEAAFLVNSNSLDRQPAIGDALKPLSGKLDTATMQRLNYQVEVEGRLAADVARNFLRDNDLIPEGQESGKKHVDIVMAVAREDLDLWRDFGTQASRAVQPAFPDRTIVHKEVRNPMSQVAEGEARLALVGSERFFLPQRGRFTRVEAVAVVGTREIHLVRRADYDGGKDLFEGRIGLPPRHSGGGMVGKQMLGDKAPHRYENEKALLDHVADGSLDGALILARPGDDELAKSFAGGKLKLMPLAGWMNAVRSVQMPYLRPASIAAKTYRNQAKPVETLRTQVVIACAAPGATVTSGAGPASALPIAGLPLTRDQVQIIEKNTGYPEAPDPVLPSALRSSAPRTEAYSSFADDVLKTVLNILAIAFLAWLVIVVRKPVEEEKEEEAKPEAPAAAPAES